MSSPTTSSTNIYSGISPSLNPVSSSSDSSGDDKFGKAAAFTFDKNVEGGYTVDNSVGTGMPTNYGIRQDTLDSYNKSKGYDPMNVSDMTSDDARHVAKDMYFDSAQFDKLPDRTAVAAFDYGYNSGPHQAIKDLQRTVGTTADGLMGDKTISAVNNYIDKNGEDALLNDYIGRRKTLMRGLVSSNPMKYGQNALGWAHRIGHLQAYLGLGASGSDSDGSMGGQ